MKLKKETMSKHFIYHIFGKKIGVTTDVIRRMREQGIKEGEYEIIEEHTNDKTASVRERELQIEKEYKVDKIPYWKTIRNSKKAYNPISQANRAAKCEKSVLQFDKQGNFIKQWDSIRKASVIVNGFEGSIGNCLKGRIKSAGGYVWKYAN